MLRPDPADLLFRIILVFSKPQLALFGNHIEYLYGVSNACYASQ